MDTSTSIDVRPPLPPPGLENTCGLVSTMRTRLGFSLAISKDESHSGGKGVRKTRNEGERDSADASGDGWP